MVTSTKVDIAKGAMFFVYRWPGISCWLVGIFSNDDNMFGKRLDQLGENKPCSSTQITVFNE